MWRFKVFLYAYIVHFRLLLRTIRRTKSFPNVYSPKRVQDKYFWRKIFDHNPDFVIFADKLAAKDYCASKCPEIAIPEVYWSGDDIEKMPEDMWHTNGVLKTNHGSSQNVFLGRDARSRKDIKKRMKKWLSRPYGKRNGEWSYGQVKPKAFVEELLTPTEGSMLEEFNIFVANGRTIHTQHYIDRYGPKESLTIYDRDGNVLPPEPSVHKTASLEVPDNYSYMIKLAEKLAQGVDYIRCDLYFFNNKVYFCEMTVYPKAGLSIFHGEKLIRLFEKSWRIQDSWFAKQNHKGWREAYVSALTKR